MDNCDIIVESGYNKPLARACLEDKPTIVQSISLHQVILKSLGEIQQFHDGLKALNVASTLARHGDVLKSFFSNDRNLQEPLTAGILMFVFIYIKCYVYYSSHTFW